MREFICGVPTVPTGQRKGFTQLLWFNKMHINLQSHLIVGIRAEALSTGGDRCIDRITWRSPSNPANLVPALEVPY